MIKLVVRAIHREMRHDHKQTSRAIREQLLRLLVIVLLKRPLRTYFPPDREEFMGLSKWQKLRGRKFSCYWFEVFIGCVNSFFNKRLRFVPMCAQTPQNRFYIW